MANLSPFCTCQDLECPLHPANHDRGCSPCIQKNLRMREAPSCMFNLVDGGEGGHGYTIEAFARLVLGKEEP